MPPKKRKRVSKAAEVSADLTEAQVAEMEAELFKDKKAEAILSKKAETISNKNRAAGKSLGYAKGVGFTNIDANKGLSQIGKRKRAPIRATHNDRMLAKRIRGNPAPVAPPVHPAPPPVAHARYRATETDEYWGKLVGKRPNMVCFHTRAGNKVAFTASKSHAYCIKKI